MMLSDEGAKGHCFTVWNTHMYVAAGNYFDLYNLQSWEGALEQAFNLCQNMEIHNTCGATVYSMIALKSEQVRRKEEEDDARGKGMFNDY